MNEKITKVKSTTDPKKLAGSILHSIDEGKTPIVSAIGATAVNNAVKGIAIASAIKGGSIVAQPTFETIPSKKEDTDDFVVMQFHVMVL